VALSLLGLINRISHPHDAILSAVPGHGFHDLGDISQTITVPGLIAYRFYAPLLFPNAGHFVARIRTIIAASPTPVRWFLLDAQAITDIDVTAAEALHGLTTELQQRGIALKIAHANPPLRKILQRIGFAGEISEESFYPSVHECVAAFERGRGRDPQKPVTS
jgi:SulP family sulfate permease